MSSQRLSQITAIIGALLLAGAGPVGWRGDGTAVFRDAMPPTHWDLSASKWSIPTKSWGNSSPILAGDLLCYGDEPVTLTCVDAATGAHRWSEASEYTDTLPADQAEQINAKLAKIPGLQSTYRDLQGEYSRLQREVRRATADPAVAQRLVGVTTELSRQRAALDELLQYATPDDKEIIGYESPTPLYADGALFVLYGNGVLSRFTTEGQRQWSVWLGEARTPMHGYPFGTSASPLMADGVLVVGYRHLTGIDPNTGGLKWKVQTPFKDFGTPAVARVEGTAVVVTASGQAVRASDGVVVAEGLPEVCYLGPHARGDQVWFVGMCADKDNGGVVDATALSLAFRTPDELTVTTRWTTPLHTTNRFYTTPVVDDGRLYVITRDGEAWALRDADGSIAWNQDLQRDVFHGDIYEGPTVAGDHVFIGDETGAFGVFAASEHFELTAQFNLGPMRATPFFHGKQVFVRTLSTLHCFEQ